MAIPRAETTQMPKDRFLDAFNLLNKSPPASMYSKKSIPRYRPFLWCLRRYPLGPSIWCGTHALTCHLPSAVLFILNPLNSGINAQPKVINRPPQMQRTVLRVTTFAAPVDGQFLDPLECSSIRQVDDFYPAGLAQFEFCDTVESAGQFVEIYQGLGVELWGAH
ncbi:uncharacterized protein BJX67DRAFT_378929 [Aspergillus lucknowensis]|uniref:Uncharacterized protein n=1 Tax=Aspergillus lucknowensis TaxID=176173 RepID=A0ABR4LZB1_9EURO